MKRFIYGFSLFLIFFPKIVWCQSSTTPPDEKRKLELERLQLENDRLKLEVEKLKFEATKVIFGKTEPKKEDVKKVMENQRVTMTRKAETLAKENKNKVNVLVLDFMNSEIWHHGVRYSIHELSDLMEEGHWKMDRHVAERSSGGNPRYLYRLKNISLLKYDGQKKGILTLLPNKKEDDFQMITPEGTTLDSLVGEIRNAYQNGYFSYEGEKEEGKLKILKYIHKVEWNFSDRLEYAFDHEGKLANIRYGVLDEH